MIGAVACSVKANAQRNNDADNCQNYNREYKIIFCIAHFETPPKGLLRVRLVICGAMIFISKIENETPSG